MDVSSAKHRVLSAAMRLFGENGYSATTIAQIEEAAGLSPGSGGLYRHFPSKLAVLKAGVAANIASGAALKSLLGDTGAMASLPLRERLMLVAQAGLRRLEQERDLNRLVLRDLAQFPDLLARVGREDIGQTFATFAPWLRSQASAGDERDWEAVAAVLMGAITHYWIMTDIFGEHPAGIDQDRYLDAAVALATAHLTLGAGSGMSTTSTEE
jgi:AcrR family transcriptional regulator